MHTWLPFADFGATARSLDNWTLGRQRATNLTIMKSLFWGTSLVDPGLRMWFDNEGSLLLYHVAICDEWTNRGYKDTYYSKAFEVYGKCPLPHESYLPPLWLGDEDFHRSQQSALIAKDAAHYGPQFPEVPDNLPYIWPAERDD